MSVTEVAEDREIAVEELEEEEERDANGRTRPDERQACPHCRILLSFREMLVGRCGTCHREFT